MISINLPSNVLSLFSLLNDVANMNLIDMDDISTSIFDFDNLGYPSFTPFFDFMNYQSSNLIQNLGLLFYVIFLNLFIMISALSLQLFGLVKK